MEYMIMFMEYLDMFMEYMIMFMEYLVMFMEYSDMFMEYSDMFVEYLIIFISWNFPQLHGISHIISWQGPPTRKGQWAKWAMGNGGRWKGEGTNREWGSGEGRGQGATREGGRGKGEDHQQGVGGKGKAYLGTHTLRKCVLFISGADSMCID